MLDAFLNSLFKLGALTIIDAGGRARTFGDGTGEAVVVRLHGNAAARLARNPGLALGECYAEGLLTLEKGDIYDLMEVVGRNMGGRPKSRGLMRKIRIAIKRRIHQVNDRMKSLRNVSHHYDLSYDLYRRFLDADMQYSCAYFARPDMTLEEAQAAKKAHLAAKLDLRPGVRVLDIGCGWGGLGLSLAQFQPQSQVTGVTLSKEQLAVARRRVEEQGLGERVSFELRDYRDLTGTYDRIVSVGMFEHVGVPHYQEFFDNIARLLTDDGIMVLHSVGRRDGPGVTNAFVDKYIFPGGYVPALSEVLPYIERAGLWVTDIEILRLHYAETLKAWRERFLAARGEIAAVYDDKFLRLWEYYLASSEISFRHLGQMNFQIQLTRRVGALPITRDYIGEAEAGLAARKSATTKVESPRPAKAPARAPARKKAG